MTLWKNYFPDLHDFLRRPATGVKVSWRWPIDFEDDHKALKMPDKVSIIFKTIIFKIIIFKKLRIRVRYILKMPDKVLKMILKMPDRFEDAR